MTNFDLKQSDFKAVVNSYNESLKPHHRYASFDYCYNYFRTTEDLTKDMEKSCLTLGFYLASWGMYRASSFMLQHSSKHLQKTIEYIAGNDRSLWDIDVDNYDKNMEKVIKVYHGIKKSLIGDKYTHLTLSTKVLLGVYGFVPAFDDYFCSTFRGISNKKCGFRSFNTTALTFIKDFYEANESDIDELSAKTFTVDFLTGQKTEIHYTKAKIIDMYGFQARKTKREAEALEFV